MTRTEVDDLASRRLVPELVARVGNGCQGGGSGLYRSRVAPGYDPRHAAAGLSRMRVPLWMPLMPVFVPAKVLGAVA